MELQERTSKFVTTAGWRLHYHDTERGAPVLFLHGSGPGATGWSNFQLNVEPLAEHFRVLLLDQPGWGRSDAFEAAPGGHMRAILEFVDALELERVSLVGNSLGGINAIEFAMEHPDRVDRLVTMGTPDLSGPATFAPAGPSLGLQAVYRGYAVRTHEAFKNLVDVMTFGEAFLDDALVAERLRSALSNEAQLDAFLARAKLPRAGGVNWTAEKLSALPHESLLIHGRDDRVVPFEGTLRLLALIPHARALIFNECGHWAQLEKAAEFNHTVAAFLADGRNTPHPSSISPTPQKD